MAAPAAQAQFLPGNSPKTMTRYKIDLKGSSFRRMRDVSTFLSGKGYDIAGVNYRKRVVEVILNDSEAYAFRQRFGSRVTLIRIESKTGGYAELPAVAAAVARHTAARAAGQASQLEDQLGQIEPP